MKFSLFVVSSLISLFSYQAMAFDMDVYPTSINFGSVYIGYTRTDSVRIYNRSQTEGLLVRVQQNCYGDFTANSSCYGKLPPGGSCGVNVSFRPNRDSYQSCYISISGDDGSDVDVSVSGRGMKR